MESEKKGISLFQKIFSGYLIAILVIVAISAIIVTSSREFSAHSSSAMAHGHFCNSWCRGI